MFPSESVDPPDWLAFSGDQVQFIVNATDADTNDILSYQLINGPEGANFNPVTRVFSWTSTSADIDQTFSIRFLVEDNGMPALSDTLELLIGVLDGTPVLLQ